MGMAASADGDHINGRHRGVCRLYGFSLFDHLFPASDLGIVSDQADCHLVCGPYALLPGSFLVVPMDASFSERLSDECGVHGEPGVGCNVLPFSLVTVFYLAVACQLFDALLAHSGKTDFPLSFADGDLYYHPRYVYGLRCEGRNRPHAVCGTCARWHPEDYEDH